MRSTAQSRALPRPASRRRAMTLIEVLVATAVSAAVLGCVVAFFIQYLRIYSYDSKKLQVNRDLRAFTGELSDTATYANYALIYPDFVSRTNISPVTNPDTGNITTSGVNVPVADGQSGDMLVLVFVDSADDTKISRLVGYYRAADDDGEGPVRRFDRNFSPASALPAVSLLPATDTIDDWPEVIELSRGLSDGRLFHNFYGRSVMVKGELIHEDIGAGRRATNTYNFTISPRG